MNIILPCPYHCLLMTSVCKDRYFVLKYEGTKMLDFDAECSCFCKKERPEL